MEAVALMGLRLECVWRCGRREVDANRIGVKNRVPRMADRSGAGRALPIEILTEAKAGMWANGILEICIVNEQLHTQVLSRRVRWEGEKRIQMHPNTVVVSSRYHQISTVTATSTQISRASQRTNLHVNIAQPCQSETRYRVGCIHTFLTPTRCTSQLVVAIAQTSSAAV